MNEPRGYVPNSNGQIAEERPMRAWIRGSFIWPITARECLRFDVGPWVYTEEDLCKHPQEMMRSVLDSTKDRFRCTECGTEFDYAEYVDKWRANAK